VNRTFASQEEAYDLFNQYAKKKGFGIRKGSVKIKKSLKRVFCIVRFIAIELLIGAVLKKKKTECLSRIGNLESMKEERDLTFYEWKSRKDVKEKRD
jgi:protein gp37